MATIPETLAIAIQDHQAGRLQAAEQAYRQILSVEPKHADALHLLGVIAAQMGKLDVAVEYVSRAIRLKGNVAAFHNNLGNALRDQGKLDEAVACYRRAQKLKPDYAEAAYNLGNVLRDRGKLDEAAACYRRALKLKRDYADAHTNLGLALKDQGKLDEAVACYRRALELKPNSAEAHFNLGSVLKDRGKPDEAVACCRRALELKPDFAEAHSNLGNALRDQGKLDEAIVCYRRALELKPDYALAHSNLGVALKDLGELDEAVACCRRAMKLKPDLAEANNNLGVALQEQKKLDEAIASYRRAVELKPDFAVVYNNLGNTLKLRDRHAEARATYEQALRLNPGQKLLRLTMAAVCPAFFECSAAIDEYRAGLLAQVEELARGKFRVDVAQLGLSAAEPPFNLLYHGRDNRPIKAAWARLFRDLPIEERACRGRAPCRAPCTQGRGRLPKLGLVVTQSHEGIFLRYWTELLRRIKPDGWEMVVVCSAAGAARVRTALSGTGVQLLPVFGQFDRIVKTIRETRFDVLCHWEAGSDSTNYFLPYFRLAPIQCSLIGMPETTGIPQMDYYLSTDLVEAEGAEAHYSEQLLRGSSMLAYHTQPSRPAVPKPREAFGVRPGQHLYVCPQNLRKFHPDFDPLLAGILERDPAGVVAVVEDRDVCIAPLLRRRFASPEYGGPALPEVLDRVLFRPYADYLGLVSAADVVLDSLYYGGGTTTLEALSFGKPIVTLPWRYSMGRGVLGCYRRMGIAGFVAEDAAEYVRMAVALGTDADYREAAGREINAASGVLFEDAQAAPEYERIFSRLIEEARRR